MHTETQAAAKQLDEFFATHANYAHAANIAAVCTTGPGSRLAGLSRLPPVQTGLAMTDADQLVRDLFVEIDRIDQMVTNIDQMRANHDCKRQLAPWALAIIGMGAGAALYTGGAALMEALGR